MMQKHSSGLAVLCCAGLSSCCELRPDHSTPDPFVASYPRTIQFKSSLPTDESKSSDITFRFYCCSRCKTVLWKETHQDVPIETGRFQVELGASGDDFMQELLRSREVYVGITVSEDPEFRPRKTLCLATSALRAINAERLDGRTANEIGTFVGMVLPFYHPVLDYGGHEDPYPFLPRNWVVCDGKTLAKEHPRRFQPEEVDPSFWGKRVPNLMGKVVRGRTTERIGSAGGSDVLPHHKHSIPCVSGSISHHDGLGNPGAHKYDVRDDHDNGEYSDRKHIVVTTGGGSTVEGQHRHELKGDTRTTQADIQVIPAHVVLYYIIRIK